MLFSFIPTLSAQNWDLGLTKKLKRSSFPLNMTSFILVPQRHRNGITPVPPPVIWNILYHLNHHLNLIVIFCSGLCSQLYELSSCYRRSCPYLPQTGMHTERHPWVLQSSVCFNCSKTRSKIRNYMHRMRYHRVGLYVLAWTPQITEWRPKALLQKTVMINGSWACTDMSVNFSPYLSSVFCPFVRLVPRPAVRHRWFDTSCLTVLVGEHKSRDC